MIRVSAIAVKISYLFTVTLALLGGSWFLVQTGASLASVGAAEFASHRNVGEYLVLVLLALVFIVPSVRAFARLMLRGELIPDSHLAERPVVTTLVFLSSAAGTTLIGLIVWALSTTLPETRDINLGGPIVLAIALYTIALLSGEIVLVGRTGRIRS